MRFLLPLLFTATLALAADDFVESPLHRENPDIPKGTVTKMPVWESKIFAGTTRDWWIYVPAQYKAEQAAAVMIFQDGHDYVNLKGNWRVPTVFDNLIASGDMPVTIALFINPGHNGGSPKPESAWKSNNRGKEYNTLGNTYVRFLLDEVLPLVQKDYKLSEKPQDWAIGGASSGAICAFTVAWERPDKFGKVFSTIGSYVDLAGGNAYPYLIRVHERKPIRIFMQEGENDLDNPCGNWPLANKMMHAALTYMKYDVKFELGDGQHNSKHGGAIFPEAMKWLWRKDK